MATVIVTHAINTKGEGLWYPDLRAELTKRGHDVEVLELPSPNAPSPDPWLATLTDAVGASAPSDTVLVGHSVGGVNTLRMLQRHSGEPFAGVVLVATMAHEVGFDALGGFFVPAFDWDRIRRAALHFRLLIAADDGVLTPDPFDHAKQFVTKLGATAVVKPTGGHLPNWTPRNPARARPPARGSATRPRLPQPRTRVIRTGADRRIGNGALGLRPRRRSRRQSAPAA